MLDVNFFDELRIGLATGDDIRQWSHGEVKKPRRQLPHLSSREKTGSSARRSSSYPGRECYCGKYKRVRFKGISASGCGVEVTAPRCGGADGPHRAAAPSPNIGTQGVPEPARLSGPGPEGPREIIYFAAYPDHRGRPDARHRDLPQSRPRSRSRRSGPRTRVTPTSRPAEEAETDLAELETEAPSPTFAQVREGGEREMRQIRDRAQRRRPAWTSARHLPAGWSPSS